MKIILYKASTGTIIDKVINVWTGSYGYSHCEVTFDHIYRSGQKQLCCSASPRSNKVRFTYINIQSKHWEIIDIPEINNAEKENEIFKYLKELEGQKYDWFGIFFYFVLPKIKKQSDKKWWCSEICASVLDKFVKSQKFRISPNKLAKNLNAPKLRRKIIIPFISKRY